MSIQIGKVLSTAISTGLNAIAPGVGTLASGAVQNAVGDWTIGKSAAPTLPASPPDPPPSPSTIKTTSNGKPIMRNDSPNGAAGTTFSNPNAPSASLMVAGPTGDQAVAAQFGVKTALGSVDAGKVLTQAVAGSTNVPLVGPVHNGFLWALGIAATWAGWRIVRAGSKVL